MEYSYENTLSIQHVLPYIPLIHSLRMSLLFTSHLPQSYGILWYQMERPMQLVPLPL